MGKKVSYTYRLEPEQLSALKAKALRYGISVSTLIREATAQYTRDYGFESDAQASGARGTRVALDYLTWIRLRSELAGHRGEVRRAREEIAAVAAALNAAADLDAAPPDFASVALAAERLGELQRTIDKCLEALESMKDGWAPVPLLGAMPEDLGNQALTEEDLASDWRGDN